MRQIITAILIFSCIATSAQVDQAVKQVMKPTTDSLRDAIAKSVPAGVIWDEVLVVPVTRAGNIDTLTVSGIYELSVTGNATAVRIVAFNNGTIRTSNPMTWAGVGTWSTSVVNGRVIISTTTTGIIYQRRKL